MSALTKVVTISLPRNGQSDIAGPESPDSLKRLLVTTDAAPPAGRRDTLVGCDTVLA